MKRGLVSFILLLCLMPFIYAAPPLRTVGLGDFFLTGGDILEDCRIGYRTAGQANADSSNVILYPTWFGGTSEHIWNLIRIHDFVDTTAYFVIMADALGNGVSSSPSNSATQAGRDFPDIRIADMARCEYALLQKLGIKKLHAVIGGSMGSMQGFEFIVRYPGMVEKAVLYVSTPRESAYDLLRGQTGLGIIELGRKYGIPEAEYMRPVRIALALNGKSPDFFAGEMAPEDVPAFLGGFDAYDPGIFPADNFYCQSRAIYHHDISREDGGDMDKTAQRIRTKMLIIVNKQDHLVSPKPALDLAKKTGAKTLILDNNRGHLGITHEIGKVRRAMARFLDS